MNILTQEAKKNQAIVESAKKKGKSDASRKYGVSLSSVKRWCKRYDVTWQSLVERTHRPHSNPNRHTKSEKRKIKKAFSKYYARYGWYGVYEELRKKHYTRNFSGMVYAAKRMGLTEKPNKNKPPRKTERRYPEVGTPGEKVQIDVKEVPYNCLRGDALKYGKHLVSMDCNR